MTATISSDDVAQDLGCVGHVGSIYVSGSVGIVVSVGTVYKDIPAKVIAKILFHGC